MKNASPFTLVAVAVGALIFMSCVFTAASILVPEFATVGATMATIVLGALGTAATTMFGAYLVRDLKQAAASEAEKAEKEEEEANVR